MKLFKFLIPIVSIALLAACSEEEDKYSYDSDYEEDANVTVTLSGNVVCEGEPVNAAAVLLTPDGGTCITGSDGFFAFNDIPAGNYEVKVYKEGCQPFNKSVTLRASQEIALTITDNSGNLLINKGYIDMGSNASNNVAAFTITNRGNSEVQWQATWGARWITKVEPSTGTIPAGGSAAVSFTINRDRFSAETLDNHTAVVVKSLSSGDGSVAEVLVTAFGQGNGVNLTNDNSDLDYVVIGNLYVQTVDMSESGINHDSAERLCRNSVKGGFNDWRLPTIDELATLYENRLSIGGFAADLYWSGTPTNSVYYFFGLNFSSGKVLESGESYSRRVRAVRTDPVPHKPEVKTLDATDIGANIVTLVGKIEDDGLPKYTECGFVISNQPSPTVNNGTKYIVDGQNTGEFKYIVDGLKAGKNYNFVAYATNELGTVYGEVKSFMCQDPLFVRIPELHLMVQRNDFGLGSMSQAENLCRNSRVGGFSDWRLPTIDEWVSIATYADNYGLTFNKSYSDQFYWSSTPDSAYEGEYYIYSFYYHRSYSSLDYRYNFWVRAVRTYSPE